MTIRLESGGKIKYNVKNDEDRNRYNPVKRVDPDTGEITYTDSTGTLKYKRNTRMQESTKMMEVDDANTLVSKFRNPKELEYANYANDMKAMANRARKEMVTTKETDYSSSAKNAYAKEVSSLNAKLNEALKNAPKERLAQIKANAEIDKKKAAYKETHDGKDMPSGDLKKLKQQTLSKYRTEVGSIARRDRSIEITDREWEAIQAGAISKSQLRKILNNTDADNLRQRAMPRTTTQLTTAKVNRIRSLSASNYSLQEIASKLGVSTATIAKYLKGKE
jgi:DNA-binding CsgD family transcriptional regulator